MSNTVYDRLSALADRDRKIDATHYQNLTKRHEHEVTFHKATKPFLDQNGLSLFTDEALAHPDAIYLVVDPRHHSANDYTSHVVIQRVRLHQTPDGLRAVDDSTNEDLGEINAWSFRYRNNEPDWMKYSNDPGRRPVWTDIRFSSLLLVLPLAGCSDLLMQHNHAKAMHRLAIDLLAGKFGVAELRECDANTRELQRQAAALKDSAASIAKEALIGVNVDPALHALIRTMDITYDEADRPSKASGEQEAAIRTALNKLPLDTAAAIFVAAKPIYWTYCRQYLYRHPALIAERLNAQVDKQEVLAPA